MNDVELRTILALESIAASLAVLAALAVRSDQAGTR